MKNTLKVIGIIALVAAIGFMAVSCKEPSDGLEGRWSDGNYTSYDFNGNGGYFYQYTGSSYSSYSGTYTISGSTVTLDGGSTFTLNGNTLTNTADSSKVYTKQ